MNNSLDVDQWKEIMNIIAKNHSFGKYGQTKWVKYVMPSFDMRDGKCFFIKFRYAGGEIEFSHTDDKPMYDAILEWLSH